MRNGLRAALLSALLATGPVAVPGLAPAERAFAVEPDEVLADPALEARARDLSAGLRCLVCQNQSIDDSNADLAKDLRILVRQRLVAGDTDQEVIDYLVSRYGEFVLLRPRFDWQTAALWGAPIGLLVIGGLFALVASRRRNGAPAGEKLSAAEEKALQEALRQRRG